MDPNQNVIWANLADAYVGLAATKTGADQQAPLDKALEAYSKAIALKPDNPAYHNNYALTLAKAKKFDEAQNELNKAAQLDPTNAGRYYYNLVRKQRAGGGSRSGFQEVDRSQSRLR